MSEKQTDKSLSQFLTRNAEKQIRAVVEDAFNEGLRAEIKALINDEVIRSVEGHCGLLEQRMQRLENDFYLLDRNVRLETGESVRQYADGVLSAALNSASSKPALVIKAILSAALESMKKDGGPYG